MRSLPESWRVASSLREACCNSVRGRVFNSGVACRRWRESRLRAGR
jgi:hypothetical protein